MDGRPIIALDLHHLCSRSVTRCIANWLEITEPDNGADICAHTYAVKIISILSFQKSWKFHGSICTIFPP